MIPWYMGISLAFTNVLIDADLLTRLFQYIQNHILL